MSVYLPLCYLGRRFSVFVIDLATSKTSPEGAMRVMVTERKNEIYM